MNKGIIAGFLVSIFSMIGATTHASHVTAGEIIYECLSNGEFVVTLNVYRDCEGVDLSFFQTVEVFDDCGNFFSFEPTFVDSSEISQLCPTDIPNSACNGGSLPGIEVYTFRDTVIIPPCRFTTFSWAPMLQECRDRQLG